MLLFLFPGYTSMAQGNVTLSGTVVDAGTKKPVEFASVAQINKEGEILDGATCNVQGIFVIPVIYPG